MPFLNSTVQQVAAAITINGLTLDLIESVDLISDAHLGANRFSATLPLTADILQVLNSLPLTVTLALGTDGISASLLTGDADAIDVDPLLQSISISGRDLTSRFLKAQTQETFENQTASSIVSLLAQRRGLIADVTPTSSMVGRYYDHTRTRTALLQHSQVTCEWDLLTWLAANEGFDVWVDGYTVYFHPPQSDRVSFTVAPTDCLSIQMHRRLDIAAGVTVQVGSWNCQTHQLVSQSASTATGDGGLQYSVVEPNLSTNDATSLAQRLLSQISGHQRNVDLTMPGDLTSSPRSLFQLYNTSTDFDGSYRIWSIRRQFDVARGFVQHIQARATQWTNS